MGIALHYDFLTTPSLTGHDTAGLASTTPDLSITRATKATVVKSDGLIHEVSAGVARFTGATYSGDTASGTSTKGLLIEEARTQQAIWTEDISNAAWVASNITKGTTAVTAPDGASNSNVRLTASAANGTLLQTLTSASATRVYSVYMKRVTGTGNIDLTLDGGSTWTTQTLTSDWQRFYITQAAVTNPSFGVRIVTSGDAIDFWGSELNSGATFPTSYISNNSATASVTRNADFVNTTDVSWYNDDASSVYWAGDSITPSSFTGSAVLPLWSIGSDSGNDFFSYITRNNDRFNYSALTGIGNDGTGILGTFEPDGNTLFRAAVGVDATSLIGFADGSAGSEDTTVTRPPSILADELRVGQRQGSEYWNGHIAELAYIDEREPNSLLSDLSDGTVTLAEQYGSDTVIERRRRAHYKRQKLRAQGFKGRETWAGNYKGRRF